jgi:hypothetical protein
MIDIMSNPRDDFAKRMHFVCDRLGLPKEKRQTLLANKYKKTITTGRNWLVGLKIPDYETALKICKDAGVNYEWLMTGNGLSIAENSSAAVIVTDPDLIKMILIGEQLPVFARKQAVKEVDNINQLVNQTRQEYKGNGTEK